MTISATNSSDYLVSARMDKLPTKQEILEKYRHLINADDFEILAASELPTPLQMQREGAWFRVLGPLKGFHVLIKRTVLGGVAAICFIGSFGQGLEYVEKYSLMGIEKVHAIAQYAHDHLSNPATELLVAVQNNEPIILPDRSFQFTTLPPMNTTTTPMPWAPESPVSGGGFGTGIGFQSGPASASFTGGGSISEIVTGTAPPMLTDLPAGSGIVPFSPTWKLS